MCQVNALFDSFNLYHLPDVLFPNKSKTKITLNNHLFKKQLQDMYPYVNQPIVPRASQMSVTAMTCHPAVVF